MKTIRLFVAVWMLFAVYPAYAALPYNTDGAEAGGNAHPAYAALPYAADGAGLSEEVPPLSAPAERVDITTMRLSNPLDLSDKTETDDSAAIEEAIGRISVGQALYLPSGTYNLSHVIHLKSGKSIIGENQATTILKVQDGTTGAAVKGDAVSDCVIENLTIISDWTGRYPESTTTPNPDAGQLKYGVLLYAAERTAVRNLRIESFNLAGIAVCSGKHCRLENNTIQNATELSEGGHGYGILLQDRDGTNRGVTNSILEGNKLLGPYLRHGVLLQAFSNHNMIQNNRFEDIRLDALDLHGEGEHHNEIAYNEIERGGESGVGVGNGPLGTHGAAGSYNYVHDNTISGCVYGVTVMMGTPHTILAENRIASSVTAAVRLRRSEDTVIYGNAIGNLPTAVLFQREAYAEGGSGGAVHTVLENNTIEDVENVCLLEQGAAEDDMFSMISGNGGKAEHFLSVLPADDSSLAILAGYDNAVLTGVGTGIGKTVVLPEQGYRKIAYFRWEMQSYRPRCAPIVLYDTEKQ